MLLFSSVYDHHKVRSAFRTLAGVLQVARERKLTLGGVKLESPVDFLRVDESVLTEVDGEDADIERMLTSIRNRVLPKRSLVITKDVLKGSASEVKFLEFGKQRKKLREMEHALASDAKCETVFIDIPPTPHFVRMGEHSMVKISNDRVVPLAELYPTAGWVAGYSQYRHRAYVMATPGCEQAVYNLSLRYFANEGIQLDEGLCSDLAKHSGIH